MPKAPCARLMKFINPSVTDRPTDRTNNSIPKANPSNSTMTILPITIKTRALWMWISKRYSRPCRIDPGYRSSGQPRGCQAERKPVVICGPGGCGKTARAARRGARRLISPFASTGYDRLMPVSTPAASADRIAACPRLKRGRARPGLLGAVQRVLHIRDLVDDDVLQLAINLLNLADVDRLNHVARLGLDGHRPARALPRHALGRCHEDVAAGSAIGLLHHLVDEVHAVIPADREQVGSAPIVRLAIAGDELVVERVVALKRVVEGGDDAARRLAHAFE